MKKVIVLLIIMLIAVSTLFRGLFFAFESSVFLLALAILSFVYFMTKLTKHEQINFDKWLLLFNVLIVVSYVLAFVKTVYLRDHIHILSLYCEYMILLIVLYDYYHKKSTQFKITVSIFTVICGFVNAIIGIVALSGYSVFLKETLNSQGQRVGGTFQYANTASLFYTICIVLTVTLILTSKKRIIKMLMTAVGSILFLAIILTGSRGGIIVASIAFFLFFILQPKGYRLLCLSSYLSMFIPSLVVLRRISQLTGNNDIVSISIYLLGSLIISFLLSFIIDVICSYITKFKIRILASSKILVFCTLIILLIISLVIILFKDQFLSFVPESIKARFQRLGLSDRNIILRLAYDEGALKLIADNWIIGTGGGAWSFLVYKVQKFFYICKDVHNHYLQIFLEAGILAFLTFVAMITLSAYRYIRNVLKQTTPTEKIYSIGFFISFISLAIHSSFDFNLSFVSMAFLFWLLMIAAALRQNSINDEVKESEKKPIVSDKPVVLLFLAILSSALISLNGLFSLSGFNEYMAVKYKGVRDYKTSMMYFEEASRLDSLNSEYPMQLTRLYNYYGDISVDPENSLKWRERAFKSINRSIDLNPFSPKSIEILSLTYLKAKMPYDALINTQKLLKIQPMLNSNYSLLARCYYELAKHNLMQNETIKAKEALMLCMEIELPPNVEESKSLIRYKQKAFDLLEKVK